MKNRKRKIFVLKKESYLQMIKNSVGTKMFCRLYASVDGKRQDILQDGNVSCAYFISSILLIFGLIKKVHATVDGTIEDMKKSGWRRIKSPKLGSVLVWEKQKLGEDKHSHIGFYTGYKKAISNSSVQRTPVEHSFTFGGKRRIKAVYWHKNLD
ncbi:MAG: hypothetical protein A2Y98_01105 [Candidatus Portnoybacteria bacterium RBG_19FT_COMBO_36_7]|uniref:NlpC/P60 domain-containing protein n=1 Tax=Candidatus Portnoybacteria bacterium RBG_19FT_COMBO_36_7 TaxID=1801992 RepID=A0A1G2F647_9BACT|nr:MAG: hypothetical protein A2Y98_01105 [Candidatus Portnoybacteria bacterium RBG_19FT_COMBO_36_7]